MTAVIGRVWGWVRPTVSYRPWGSSDVSENTTTDPGTNRGLTSSSWGFRGLTSWVYRGGQSQTDQTKLAEEFWEAEEKLQPLEIEDLGAGKQEMEAMTEHAPRWWNKILPTSFLFWSKKKELSGLRQRKHASSSQFTRDCDSDGEFSDYGTPPPSPTPCSSPLSPFHLFAQSWSGEILPEHYEICFNFLRHLFDLFVVGFLWTVSPPTKLILEVLGVQGTLRLWLHGMAMFFVSTTGMAGLLWLIQEYLPQFALIYGIVQVLVISVSVRQSVMLGEEGEKEERDDEVKESEEIKDKEHEEKHIINKREGREQRVNERM
ncbi:uncharacterized protein C6orf47 homolog [Lampris incognitus]|uniref:uncharacterized protein C6orf47 homolog n=1 Tax=Lampris incognitus TaxID=2546036 RepID=UPI0024B4E28C|nr:uncharacterized protein C6orf47 homolog [Lampris incognitus]XP_056154218.1 uncharacterized protein C6orf47 homolog [Lampris incognitus]XP_056154219.1 uncharacterized protein C6orf47 homolog [Lampris incognitus]